MQPQQLLASPFPISVPLRVVMLRTARPRHLFFMVYIKKRRLNMVCGVISKGWRYMPVQNTQPIVLCSSRPIPFVCTDLSSAEVISAVKRICWQRAQVHTAHALEGDI